MPRNMAKEYADKIKNPPCGIDTSKSKSMPIEQISPVKNNRATWSLGIADDFFIFQGLGINRTNCLVFALWIECQPSW